MPERSPTAYRVSRRGRASAAPVEPHQFGRAPGEIPVSAESAYARCLGASNGYILADPVGGISDDDVLAFFFSSNRLHHPFDDLGDLENVRVVLNLVNDFFSTDAKKRTNKDFQQAGRAARFAG